MRSIKEATARLDALGIVQSKATGREKICLLGEWVDSGQRRVGSVRKKWDYLERVFTGRGAEICTSEVQGAEETPSGATNCPPAVQEVAPSNIQENRENINALERVRKEPGHVEYVVNEILKVCGDEHSRPYYYTRLTAQLPDHLIFRCLAEIRQDPTVATAVRCWSQNWGRQRPDGLLLGRLLADSDQHLLQRDAERLPPLVLTRPGRLVRSAHLARTVYCRRARIVL